mmetsp:Transcript_1831/g.3969  ORF Transcript_1831/g.3969 Transcript_1831/m.3969 type:complete len:123 (-) Transcript_1831:1807-2175(-)
MWHGETILNKVKRDSGWRKSIWRFSPHCVLNDSEKRLNRYGSQFSHFAKLATFSFWKSTMRDNLSYNSGVGLKLTSPRIPKTINHSTPSAHCYSVKCGMTDFTERQKTQHELLSKRYENNRK